MNPNYYEAYINLGNVLESRGKSKASVFYFEKAVKIKPKSYEGLCNLSHAFQEIGDASNAIKNAKLAIKLDRSKSEAFQNIGAVYFKLKNYFLAKKYYENAIKENVISSDFIYCISSLQYECI